LFDVIVIGSGPAGIFAALRLQGHKVLVLDVGNQPGSPSTLASPLYQFGGTVGSPHFDEFIGPQFESLHNINNEYLLPKLKSPLMRFVTKDSTKLTPSTSETFSPVMSLAQGGLASAWGAEVYRFTDEELSLFPFRAQDLERYYDCVEQHIGISGANDDLSELLGVDEQLYPPLRMGRLASDLYRRYQGKRASFNEKGVRVGLPRVAILSDGHHGRPSYQYDDLEFFKPPGPAVYSPALTLNHLVRDELVAYRPGYYVERYEELPNGVRVRARKLADDSREEFEARRVVLALGTMNTAKLVLASNDDYETRLPLLDNAISYVPFVNPRMIGEAPEPHHLRSIQLTLAYSGDLADQCIMGSFYAIPGILRSDLFFRFPFSLRMNRAAVKYVLPALLLLQLFYPDQPVPDSWISLEENGRLNIRYQRKCLGRVERHVLSVFRGIGYCGLPAFCDYPLPGNSFHYAGCLPMSLDRDAPYRTTPEGLLNGTRNVYVADAAVFPSIPSKPLTFTIMANAMRIADQVKRSLE